MLAFDKQGHYPNFDDGYKLYVNRSRKGESVDKKTYSRIVRMYCSLLADRLKHEGIIDLPNNLGVIAAATMKRKPQYRGKTFVGYGKKDWKSGHYDGTLKTFGIVFLPKRDRKQNLRCYGFVSNKRLFRQVREIYERDFCPWRPIEFNDEMI